MKKQFAKHRTKTTPKKKVTLDMVLKKIDTILRRLDIIENDLRELKGVVYPKSEEEKEVTPEFFMEK